MLFSNGRSGSPTDEGRPDGRGRERIRRMGGRASVQQFTKKETAKRRAVPPIRLIRSFRYDPDNY